eukprot:11192343-Lingulodinium_polyedra.AAC.1
MLENFLQTQWQWPGDKRAKGKNLHQAFRVARAGSSNEYFKTTASEMIMLLPILRYCMATVIVPNG